MSWWSRERRVADPRSGSVRFRHADAGRASSSGDEELRSLLQRRLFALAWISAGMNLGSACVGFAFSEGMQQRMSEAPLAPGSPVHHLGVGVLFIALALSLRSVHPRSVPWLRRGEVTTFAANALFITSLLIYDLGSMPGLYQRAPIDIALGHSYYWVLLIAMYGVLIPNTARRTIYGLGLFFASAFVADAWGVAAGTLPVSLIPIVVAVKTLAVGLAAIITGFGSIRYERIVRREAEARELGQYVLGRRLAAGGMGEVYMAEHRMLRRPVAIKLISAEQAGSPEATARFEREVQATAQLSHPNTVQVFDYGQAEDGAFYCVMEFLPGETLDAIVRRDGPMPVPRAVRVLTQLCGALAEAHGRGLVHRDIKPSNVILGERGGVRDVAKLLDFGLVISRRPVAGEERLTSAGTMLGTPEFMSPEQCGDDEGAVGPSTDLYSLGALGYFLLTGRSPFAGRGAVQMLAAHLYETPAPPSAETPGIPAALDGALLRCLAKRPADRFASALALAEALRAATA